MPGHRPYQVWQYDRFILPPQPLSSVGVQQGQTATAIDICRYRWNSTAATDHHGEVLGNSAVWQNIKTLERNNRCSGVSFSTGLATAQNSWEVWIQEFYSRARQPYILISNRKKKKNQLLLISTDIKHLDRDTFFSHIAQPSMSVSLFVQEQRSGEKWKQYS